MKLLAKIWSLGLLALLLSSCAPSKILAQGGDYISEQQFYDELQPYGTWVEDPQFGNVWVPDVEEDFRPYATRGHWALTEYGNTWVSEYPWGWAAFHYGRWRFDDYYGWEWIPGSEWAPAWVSWRGGDEYYGWAPLGPDVNMEASYADDYDYNIPQDYFVWVPQAYITYTNVYNYYVPRYRVRDFYNRTAYIRNRYSNDNRHYFTGPRRDEIQRVVRRPVRVYNIHDVNRPSDTRVNNNTVNIYRPAVRRAADARPSRVVDGAAYRRENPGQRIGGTDRSRGVIYNPTNANKLADAARSHNPDSRVVRVNRPQNTGVVNPPANRPQTRPDANDQARPNTPARGIRPAVTGDNRTQQQQTPEQQRQAVEQQRQQAREQQRQQQDQQQQQTREQQRQAVEQQRQQAREQQRQQQDQQQQQTREQQRQAVEQQRQQARGQQRQQQDQQQQQAREQQRQAVEQQRQQAREQQRQQQEQQQQQAREQQRQAVEQQRQQAREQQRQQQDQQQQQSREQQRQGVEQQRQQAREQQRQQQEQQQQQAREQQRQAVEQQRQQAREQQRQQQDQMREQQRQQAEQQRQQAREQQRQQAEQQRQSQPQPQQHRPRGGK